MAYIQPQLQIFQEFRQLPQNVVANLNAFITGAHYKLFRYSEASEKQFTALGEYAAGTYDYPGQPFGSIVDTDYVKLFIEDVLARYATVSSAGLLSLQVTGDGNNQISASPAAQDLVFTTGNGVLASQAFRSRGVKAGDTVRYTTSDGVSGTTRVVSFVADRLDADVAEPAADPANKASIASVALASGIAVSAGASNARSFAGVGTGVYALSDAATGLFTGSYADGTLSETLQVEITGSGLPGSAYCTVRSLTSDYVRSAVRVNANPDSAGEAVVYLGFNLWLRLVPAAGAADSMLQAGDIFTMAEPVSADFAAVSPATGVTVDGDYIGLRDTVYELRVVRGGVFERAVSVIDGINAAGADNALLTASVDFAGGAWLAGDVDDEYVVRCTTAGAIADARFAVSSRRGDNAVNISFADGAPRSVGTVGVVATLDVDAGTVFTVGDFWVVKVHGTRPRVQVTDSRGTDQGAFATIAAGAEFNVGRNGLTAQFNTNVNSEGGFAPGGGLVAGDRFYVAATAATGDAYRTLVLEDSLPTVEDEYGAVEGAAISAIEFYLTQLSTQVGSKRVQTPPLFNWVTRADGITVNGGIAVQDASWVDYDGSLPFIPVVSGNMYVEYRALLQDYVGSIFSFDTASQVAAELGTIHPDNPLAQGVHSALLNAGGRSVYFAGVRTDDVAGYSEILELVEKIDTVYSIVALSEDRAVVDAVAGHVKAMSAEDVKRWRIGWCSSALPATTELLNAELNNDEEWLATVAGPDNRTLDVVNINSTLVGKVRVGDFVRLQFATDAWGDTAWEQIRVEGVASNSRLVLERGLAYSIVEPAKIEIFRVNSASEIATRTAALASSLGSRRMYYVAPMDIHVGGVVTRPVFAAAALAGLVSSMAPQRPLTNVTLSGFSEIPAAYRVFNRNDLNTMAAGGTFILAQDTENGAIYIRHQLSTATSDGNLLTTELSVTKNLDAISYYFSGVLSPYIGRYNITPELLRVVNTDLVGGLNFMTSAYTGAGLLGPMILSGDGTAVRRVEQHPTLKDHVVAIVDLVLPLPVNVIQLRLVV